VLALILSTTSGASAFQVYGDIGAKWQALGGANGPLGDAMSDEADAAHGGRFNNFQYGFIYWLPRYGAHAVYGLIGELWNGMGRERGTCGYPTTDEYSFGADGRRSDFQHGKIIWKPGQTTAIATCGSYYQDDVIIRPSE